MCLIPTEEIGKLKKLGYVTSSELTPRVVKRTDILDLSTKFEVVVFDVRAVLGMRPRGVKTIEVPGITRHEISSWGELHHLLESEGLSALLDCEPPSHLSHKIVSRCRELGITSAQLRAGALPTPNALTRLGIRLISIMSLPSRSQAELEGQSGGARTAPLSLLALCRSYFAEQFLDIRGMFVSRPDICFFSGSKSLNLSARFARRLVPIPCEDLGDIQELAIGKKRNYLLFLDEALSDAKDFGVLGMEPPVREVDYYPWLSDSLRELGHRLNLPVLIALHPDNADRVDILKSRLEGFTIWQGPSVLALVGARGVIFHRSALALLTIEVGAVPLPLQVGFPNMTLHNGFVRKMARSLGVALQTRNGRSTRDPLDHSVSERRRKAILKKYLGPSGVSRKGLITSIFVEELSLIAPTPVE
jgi:hypothetical protein